MELILDEDDKYYIVLTNDNICLSKIDKSLCDKNEFFNTVNSLYSKKLILEHYGFAIHS